MKALSIVILLLLAIATISPLSITLSPAGDGTFLVALDVCNASNAAADSAVSAMPVVHEGHCNVLGAEFMGLIEVMPPLLHRFLIASQEDHPPQL